MTRAFVSFATVEATDVGSHALVSYAAVEATDVVVSGSRALVSYAAVEATDLAGKRAFVSYAAVEAANAASTSDGHWPPTKRNQAEVAILFGQRFRVRVDVDIGKDNDGDATIHVGGVTFTADIQFSNRVDAAIVANFNHDFSVGISIRNDDDDEILQAIRFVVANTHPRLSR